MNEDSSSSIAPGLRTTESSGVTTIHFARYRGGNGVDVDNSTGVISATNFALTDVHTFTTTALRNGGLDSEGDAIEWHTGDVAVVAPGVGPTNTGQGTYVYNNDTVKTGTTVDTD